MTQKRKKKQASHLAYGLVLVFLLAGWILAQRGCITQPSQPTPPTWQQESTSAPANPTRSDAPVGSTAPASGRTQRTPSASPSATEQTRSGSTSGRTSAQPQPAATTAVVDERADRRYGLPQTPRGTTEQVLFRPAYTVGYNDDLRIPNWVAWRLTADRADGPYERPGSNAWHEDDDVSRPRAGLADYRGSGYDRGHMFPAADAKWDPEVMYSTFLFTNCCPQTKRLNTGDWNELEISCRRWAVKYGEVFIVSGPLPLKGRYDTIGPNHVAVPKAFFKIVLRMGDHPQGIAFVMKNSDQNLTRSDYVNTIAEVERLTGYKFFPRLPADIASVVKHQDDLSAW